MSQHLLSLHLEGEKSGRSREHSDRPASSPQMLPRRNLFCVAAAAPLLSACVSAHSGVLPRVPVASLGVRPGAEPRAPHVTAVDFGGTKWPLATRPEVAHFDIGTTTSVAVLTTGAAYYWPADPNSADYSVTERTGLPGACVSMDCA